MDTAPIVTHNTPPTTIDLRPSGSDDAPQIAAAIYRAREVAGVSPRLKVRLLPGLAGQGYSVLTAVEWMASPWVELVGCTVDFGLTVADIGWLCQAQPDPTVVDTTLFSSPTIGASTLSTVGAVAAGKWIRVASADNDRAQLFKVLTSTPVGGTHSVLTLDVPIAFRFTTGDAVSGRIPPIDPRVTGVGTFTGVAQIVLDFNCVVGGEIGGEGSGLFFDVQAPFACGYDVGSRNPKITGVVVRNTGGANGNGVFAHGCVNPTISGVVGLAMVTQTISLSSSRSAKVVGCSSSSGTIGCNCDSLMSGGDGTTATLIGCYFLQASTGNVVVTDGSNVTMMGGAACYGAGYGVIFLPTTATPSGSVIGVVCTDNGLSNIAVNKATVYVTDCFLARSAGSYASGYGDLGVTNTGKVYVSGLTTMDPAVASVCITGSSSVRARDCAFVLTRTGTYFGCYLEPDSELSLDGGDFTNVRSLNAQCVYNAGGSVRYLACVGHTGMTTGYNDAGGATVFYGPAVSLPNYASNGTANRGTVTLNGVTQVAVTGFFPVDARIAFSLRTVGSTPGTAAPYFSAAQIANSFFLKSPTAGCNDVYNWEAV